jgi:hypothetical protein
MLFERFPGLANKNQELILLESNNFDAHPLGFSYQELGGQFCA